MIKSLSIEILSYWHAGSGMGRGSELDAVVIRDKDNLPYLPGRTLKGLLREGLQACEDLGHITQDTTERLCGRLGAIDSTTTGSLSISNAVLPEGEREWLRSAEGQHYRTSLYDRFAATKINAQGTAEKQTLRSIELCVPLVLWSAIELHPADNADWEAMKTACSLVRALGTQRNRGLGRCVIKLEG